MKVKVRKYVHVTAVETHEAVIEVPDGTEDPESYIEENSLLDDADWEEKGVDDNVQDEEYEYFTDDEDSEDDDEESEESE